MSSPDTIEELYKEFGCVYQTKYCEVRQVHDKPHYIAMIIRPLTQCEEESKGVGGETTLTGSEIPLPENAGLVFLCNEQDLTHLVQQIFQHLSDTTLNQLARLLSEQ